MTRVGLGGTVDVTGLARGNSAPQVSTRTIRLGKMCPVSIGGNGSGAGGRAAVTSGAVCRQSRAPDRRAAPMTVSVGTAHGGTVPGCPGACLGGIEGHIDGTVYMQQGPRVDRCPVGRGTGMTLVAISC